LTVAGVALVVGILEAWSENFTAPGVATQVGAVLYYAIRDGFWYVVLPVAVWRSGAKTWRRWKVGRAFNLR